MSAGGTFSRTGGLVLRATYRDGDFDSHLVDCPFLFRHDGAWHMTYVGWDGVGYQTGLARSDDLESWQRLGLIWARDPSDPVRRYNAAITGLLRSPELFGPAEPLRHDGRYLATYHAYPGAGYEAGSGVIGFCASDDLRTWHPVGGLLRPGDGAAWERGGLYKSWILRRDGTFFLFYNAKDRPDSRWREQTGLATSTDLVHWERHPANPVLPNGPAGSFDEFFASDPAVYWDGRQWVMWYFGLAADGHARTGLATSADLVTWHKKDRLVLDVGRPGDVDESHAHKAVAVAEDGRVKLAYTAVRRTGPFPIGSGQHDEIRGIALAAAVASPRDQTID